MKWIALTFAAASILAAFGGRPQGAPYGQWKNGPGTDAGYFPIAVWLQSPSNAARYKAAGFNTYVGLWQGPTEEQLATLKAAGMRVICEHNAVGRTHEDDPTIVGWMHGDEPDNAQPVKDAQGNDTYGPCIPPERIVADYERMKAEDPTRPIMLNLGQGVANDKWYGRGSGAKQEDYLTYVKAGDIVSFDVYPVAGLEKQNGADFLWYVPLGVERLIKWSEGKKLIWNCIECTQISEVGRKATPAQVRSEVWMALIQGSRGLIYFVHQFKPTFDEHALLDDPDMLAGVTATNKQIHELAPVLNSPAVPNGATVSASPDSVPISFTVRKHDGATYLFAVGMRNAPVTGTFALSGIRKGTAEAIGEGRSVKIADGRFTDSFKPYEVHLYRIR